MAVDELRELPAGLVDLAGGYRGLQDPRQLGVPGDVFGRQWLLEPPQAVRAGRPLECASRSQRPVDGAIRIVGVECKPAAPADCLAGCRDPRGSLLYGQATDRDLVVGEARMRVAGGWSATWRLLAVWGGGRSANSLPRHSPAPAG